MSAIRFGLILLCAGIGVAGCESSESGSQIGGDPEQAQLPQIRVNLPPSPSFEKETPPEKYADASFSVYGLRKNLKQNLNQQVKVKGHLIELYECPPCPKGATCKACEKPHFWLADRANAQKDDALLVADYPADDRRALKKMNLTLEPGAQLFVSGTFTTTSGSGFSSSDGLLVFEEASHVGE